MQKSLLANQSHLHYFSLMRLSLFCVLLCCGLSAHSTGFNVLSSEQGLNNSIVRSVTKDSNHLVWIGTMKGLYQYDGYQVSQVLTPGGESFNEVRTLATDQEGVVWIATKYEGVFYQKNGLIQAFQTRVFERYGKLHFLFVAKNHTYVVFEQKII